MGNYQTETMNIEDVCDNAEDPANPVDLIVIFPSFCIDKTIQCGTM